jgi:hypothetical protein
VSFALASADSVVAAHVRAGYFTNPPRPGGGGAPPSTVGLSGAGTTVPRRPVVDATVGRADTDARLTWSLGRKPPTTTDTGGLVAINVKLTWSFGAFTAWCRCWDS